MKVYDIIERAKQTRPGYEWDSELVEQWINECDASIQLEVAKKNPSDIRKCIPDLWDKDKTYTYGDRVHLVISGKKHVYAALCKTSACEPNEYPQYWKEVPYETYVGYPHDRLYVSYITAMMNFANREYNKYTNDRELYNAELEEFANWWQRRYRYNFVEGSDPYESEIRPSTRIQ